MKDTPSRQSTPRLMHARPMPTAIHSLHTPLISQRPDTTAPTPTPAHTHTQTSVNVSLSPLHECVSYCQHPRSYSLSLLHILLSHLSASAYTSLNTSSQTTSYSPTLVTNSPNITHACVHHYYLTILIIYYAINEDTSYIYPPPRFPPSSSNNLLTT